MLATKHVTGGFFEHPNRASLAPGVHVTSVDFSDRDHFGYVGPPLIDVHAHVWVTREGPDAGLAQAEQCLAVAQDFEVERVWTMCPRKTSRCCANDSARALDSTDS